MDTCVAALRLYPGRGGGPRGCCCARPASAPSVFGRFDHMAELAGYAQGVQFVSLSSSPTWRPNTVKPYACTVHTSHLYGYRGLCAVRKYERPLGRSLVRLLVRLEEQASPTSIRKYTQPRPQPPAAAPEPTAAPSILRNMAFGESSRLGASGILGIPLMRPL